MTLPTATMQHLSPRRIRILQLVSRVVAFREGGGEGGSSHETHDGSAKNNGVAFHGSMMWPRNIVLRITEGDGVLRWALNPMSQVVKILLSTKKQISVVPRDFFSRHRFNVFDKCMDDWRSRREVAKKEASVSGTKSHHQRGEGRSSIRGSRWQHCPTYQRRISGTDFIHICDGFQFATRTLCQRTTIISRLISTAAMQVIFLSNVRIFHFSSIETKEFLLHGIMVECLRIGLMGQSNPIPLNTPTAIMSKGEVGHCNLVRCESLPEGGGDVPV